jgi:hypothetical protein
LSTAVFLAILLLWDRNSVIPMPLSGPAFRADELSRTRVRTVSASRMPLRTFSKVDRWLKPFVLAPKRITPRANS